MKRCVKRLLHARGWRVLAQRVLLLMLFLLTLLVVVARLDAEASLRILEANTLVLQVGHLLVFLLLLVSLSLLSHVFLFLIFFLLVFLSPSSSS